jgi:hypothetical protein
MLKNTSKREVVVFRRQDEWFHKKIKQLVEVKRAMGARTSFSYEIVRLAKNGLASTLTGEDLDRSILKDDTV